MSHGSCVAACDGVPAPPASSPPRASVTAAARVSSAFLVCRNRGLTVIVESALSFPRIRRRSLAGGYPRPFCGHDESARRHAGGPSPVPVLAITSLRYHGEKAMVYRASVSVSANKMTVNNPLDSSPNHEKDLGW